MADFTLIEKDTSSSVIIDDLDKYFKDEIGFGDAYSNFGDITVGSDHPFARALMSFKNDQNLPDNLFPSVTITKSTESTHSRDVMGKPKRYILTDDLIAQFEALDPKKRLFSTERLEALRTAYDALPADYNMFVRETFSLETFKLIFSVWVDHHEVKNDMYEMVKEYVKGRAELFTNELCFNEITWSGEKDGLFNLDFGITLYGAIVTMNASQERVSYVVEDEAVSGQGAVLVIVEDLHTDSGQSPWITKPQVEFKTGVTDG